MVENYLNDFEEYKKLQNNPSPAKPPQDEFDKI